MSQLNKKMKASNNKRLMTYTKFCTVNRLFEETGLHIILILMPERFELRSWSDHIRLLLNFCRKGCNTKNSTHNRFVKYLNISNIKWQLYKYLCYVYATYTWYFISYKEGYKEWNFSIIDHCIALPSNNNIIFSSWFMYGLLFVDVY